MVNNTKHKKNNPILISFLCCLVLLIGFTIGVIFTRWQRLPSKQVLLASSDQEMHDYIDPGHAKRRLISEKKQKQRARQFLIAYFSPWRHITGLSKIKADLRQTISRYRTNKGWGMNNQPHTTTWIKGIVANINLKSFPNSLKKAIIVRNTSLRSLPTAAPSFSNPNDAGQGYPFDNLQISALWTGQPIHIVQASVDGAWVLASTSFLSGWVQSKDIAYVNNAIIKDYKRGPFAAITQDNKAVKDSNNHFLFFERIGSIFPLRQGKLLVPIRRSNQQAAIVSVSPPHKSFSKFPLSATPSHFAMLLDHLSGEPYGWGGYASWRDCSLTLKSLFAAFGIYLPRHSSSQARSGPHLDLSQLTTKQKFKVIKKRGRPFLTLIGMKGHIMLYIGFQHNHLYVFHNKWGLHTENIFHDKGRAIIGQARITTLVIGAHHRHIEDALINGINTMTWIF